ncbi:MAG: methyltransferase family protein [Candidatus Hodarchaeales archaeon]|jgi:protein-S-isoprenylcysteine O-methyltransferase Ste14
MEKELTETQDIRESSLTVGLFLKKTFSQVNIAFFSASGLSIVLTGALIYWIYELPRSMNSFFLENPEFTDQTYRTLKPLAYLTFGLILLGWLVGFLSKHPKFSFLSSLTLYLPTFGHFAATMLAFAGIGIIRIIWFPFYEQTNSWNFLQLGQVVLIPFVIGIEVILFCLQDLLGSTVSRVQLFELRKGLGVLCIKLGILIFLFSSFNWLYAKFQKIKLIDFWIYKYSRHPQYVGLLLACYGMLIQASYLTYPKGGYIPPPSLFWLVLLLMTIGIALKEELIWRKNNTQEYRTYQENVPFMIPLPNIIVMILHLPMQLLFKKDSPESSKEILGLLIFYFLLLIGGSILLPEINLHA